MESLSKASNIEDLSSKGAAMAKALVALRGDVVSTPLFGDVAIATDQLLVAEAFENGGKILALVPGDQEASVLVEHGLEPTDVERLKVRAVGCKSDSRSNADTDCAGAQNMCCNSALVFALLSAR